jgi:hypothetical protein
MCFKFLTRVAKSIHLIQHSHVQIVLTHNQTYQQTSQASHGLWLGLKLDRNHYAWLERAVKLDVNGLI